MELKKMVLASFVAMSLAACGSGDDQSQKDDHKNELPPKPQACIDAGDKCTWDGKNWVVPKPGDTDKPNDEPPAADSTFDYSDIGVTDALEAQKKGFGFYHKGVKSGLDQSWFANNPTLSPNIPWSSTLEYDEDLWNFVAIRLIDPSKKDEKNPPKFMFDEIGKENQKKNPNKVFFGKGKDTTTKVDHHDDSKFGSPGMSSIATAANATYKWNLVPALVNTYLFRNRKGDIEYVYADSDNKYFYNQEEETAAQLPDATTNNVGNGSKALRIYGHNAFLADTATDVLNQDGLDEDKKAEGLKNRKETKYYRTANYAWYDLSTYGKRKQKTTVEYNNGEDKITIKTALSKYQQESNTNKVKKVPFPTDIKLGELQSVQFGRLTGEGINPESDDMTNYNVENLKEYPFTGGVAAAAGNVDAEDWYFARGTEATPVTVLDNYKNAGKKIGYDGQAVMFGLDYRPTQPKKEGKKDDQSTNSVKPLTKDPMTKVLLDGKQNFVRMEWDPATGEISGRVYGVWTAATYWRNVTKPDDADNNKLISYKNITDNVVSLEFEDVSPKTAKDFAKDYFASFGKQPIKPDASGVKANQIELVDIATDYKETYKIVNNAFVLEPYAVTLVALKGTVTEGTNTFGGVAIRARDESKGLFTGGFFGPKGLEIGGVINSQTGSMKDKNLTDPGAVWGGAFGAKHNAAEVEEDLIFKDTVTDYMTSTEFFNK